MDYIFLIGFGIYAALAFVQACVFHYLYHESWGSYTRRSTGETITREHVQFIQFCITFWPIMWPFVGVAYVFFNISLVIVDWPERIGTYFYNLKNRTKDTTNP